MKTLGWILLGVLVVGLAWRYFLRGWVDRMLRP